MALKEGLQLGPYEVLDAILAQNAFAKLMKVALAVFLLVMILLEGLSWIISYCLDPLCPLLDDDPAFNMPSNGDIDALLPTLLLQASSISLTRTDFDELNALELGLGDREWNAARDAVRSFIIFKEGAASFFDGDCGDLMEAQVAGEGALAAQIDATRDIANIGAQIYSAAGAISPVLDEALVELNLLDPLIVNHPDPVALQQTVDDARAAILSLQAILAPFLDVGDNPLPLMGPGGILPDLSPADFMTFLNDCALNGATCLPAAEIDTTNTICLAR